MTDPGAIISSRQHWRELNKWARLRRLVKSADADWVETRMDPDTAIATVGGTADDGIYGLTFTNLSSGLVVASIEFDRQSGETNAQIAEELAAGVAASDALKDYIASATHSTTDVEMVFWGSSPMVQISTTAPAGASISLAPGDVYPLTRAMPYASIRDLDTPTGVEAVVLCYEDDDLVNPAGTVHVTEVDVVSTPAGAVPVRRGPVLAAVPVHETFLMPLNGSERWTLRLSDFSSLPAAATHLEVWVRVVRGGPPGRASEPPAV